MHFKKKSESEISTKHKKKKSQCPQSFSAQSVPFGLGIKVGDQMKNCWLELKRFTPKNKVVFWSLTGSCRIVLEVKETSSLEKKETPWGNMMMSRKETETCRAIKQLSPLQSTSCSNWNMETKIWNQSSSLFPVPFIVCWDFMGFYLLAGRSVSQEMLADLQVDAVISQILYDGFIEQGRPGDHNLLQHKIWRWHNHSYN